MKLFKLLSTQLVGSVCNFERFGESGRCFQQRRENRRLNDKQSRFDQVDYRNRKQEVVRRFDLAVEDIGPQ